MHTWAGPVSPCSLAKKTKENFVVDKSWTANVFNGAKGCILTQTMNLSLLAEKAADGLCRSVNTEYFPRTLPTDMKNVYSALS